MKSMTTFFRRWVVLPFRSVIFTSIFVAAPKSWIPVKFKVRLSVNGTVASIGSRNNVLQLQEVGDFTTNFHLKTASKI